MAEEHATTATATSNFSLKKMLEKFFVTLFTVSAYNKITAKTQTYFGGYRNVYGKEQRGNQRATDKSQRIER